MNRNEALLAKVRDYLKDGETIHHYGFGSLQVVGQAKSKLRNGVTVATDDRILFYSRRINGYSVESYPYAAVSSIELDKNWLGVYAVFNNSGTDVRLKWLNKTDLQAFVAFVKQKIETR